MSMSDWSNESTLKFLKLYQNESIIWDPKHDCHKDRKKVNDAWDRLSEQLKHPVVVLKRKKDTLMATFRSHSRKKKASFKSGVATNDIYKPIWFAFDYMESFLTPIYGRQTLNTQDTFVQDEPSQSADSVYDKENESEITEDKANIIKNTNTVVPEQPNSTPLKPRPTIPKTTIFGNPPELQEAENQMKEELKMLKNIITKRANEKEDDEYDLFGKMLAKKIKKLPEHEREVFMYEIEGMYIKKLHNINSISTYSNALSTESFDPPLDLTTPIYQNRPSTSISSYSESTCKTYPPNDENNQ